MTTFSITTFSAILLSFVWTRCSDFSAGRLPDPSPIIESKILDGFPRPQFRSQTTIAILEGGCTDIENPYFFRYLWKNTGESFNNIDDDQNGFVDDVHGWDFGNFTPAPLNLSDEMKEICLHGTAVTAVASHQHASIRVMPLKFSHTRTGNGSYQYKTTSIRHAIRYAKMAAAGKIPELALDCDGKPCLGTGGGK